MRLYMNAVEAVEEIKRDLCEMGIEIHPHTMQDKDVSNDPQYATKELQNYCYCILNPKPLDVPNVHKAWADAEFAERIYKTTDGEIINPGVAYKLREDVWNEFLNEDGKFAYTYNERINAFNQLDNIIERIKNDPESRQLWLSIWNPADNLNMGGISRVPCSLGYNFQVRDGKLNIHYIMRSCDFATHMMNDIYLAIMLLQYVCKRTGYEMGTFTHTIFSLHVYKKDIDGVF